MLHGVNSLKELLKTTYIYIYIIYIYIYIHISGLAMSSAFAWRTDVCVCCVVQAFGFWTCSSFCLGAFGVWCAGHVVGFSSVLPCKKHAQALVSGHVRHETGWFQKGLTCFPLGPQTQGGEGGRPLKHRSNTFKKKNYNNYNELPLITTNYRNRKCAWGKIVSHDLTSEHLLQICHHALPCGHCLVEESTFIWLHLNTI